MAWKLEWIWNNPYLNNHPSEMQVSYIKMKLRLRGIIWAHFQPYGTENIETRNQKHMIFYYLIPILSQIDGFSDFLQAKLQFTIYFE